METFSALKEEDADELWKEVREHKAHETTSYNSAPFSVIQCFTNVAANATLNGDALNTIEEDVLSQVNSLATLPSYIGKTEKGIEIIAIPSSQSSLAPKALRIH